MITVKTISSKSFKTLRNESIAIFESIHKNWDEETTYKRIFYGTDYLPKESREELLIKSINNFPLSFSFEEELKRIPNDEYKHTRIADILRNYVFGLVTTVGDNEQLIQLLRNRLLNAYHHFHKHQFLSNHLIAQDFTFYHSVIQNLNNSQIQIKELNPNKLKIVDVQILVEEDVDGYEGTGFKLINSRTLTLYTQLAEKIINENDIREEIEVRDYGVIVCLLLLSYNWEFKRGNSGTTELTHQKIFQNLCDTIIAQDDATNHLKKLGVDNKYHESIKTKCQKLLTHPNLKIPSKGTFDKMFSNSNYFGFAMKPNRDTSNIVAVCEYLNLDTNEFRSDVLSYLDSHIRKKK